MKTITRLICGTTALLVVLASLSPVIGYAASQSQETGSESPLFSVRIARSTDQRIVQKIQTNYLGKGVLVNIFSSSRSIFQAQLVQAFQLINDNPAMVKRLFEKIASSQGLVQLLSENGLSVSQVEEFLYQIKDNPELIKARLHNVDVSLLENDGARPLGLSTSNMLECFIAVLMFLPIAIAIGLVVATAMLFTCLNVNGCFSKIIKAIYSQLIQEITQP